MQLASPRLKAEKRRHPRWPGAAGSERADRHESFVHPSKAAAPKTPRLPTRQSTAHQGQSRARRIPVMQCPVTGTHRATATFASCISCRREPPCTTVDYTTRMPARGSWPTTGPGRRSRPASLADVIARGTSDAEGYGATPVDRAKFIVDTIRIHLAREACKLHHDDCVVDRSIARQRDQLVPSLRNPPVHNLTRGAPVRRCDFRFARKFVGSPITSASRSGCRLPDYRRLPQFPSNPDY